MLNKNLWDRFDDLIKEYFWFHSNLYEVKIKKKLIGRKDADEKFMKTIRHGKSFKYSA